VENEGLANKLVSPKYQTRCDERDRRLSATFKQNPKIDTTVESQVSESVRPFDKLRAKALGHLRFSCGNV
jgi:hypothetical protein